MTEKSNKFLVIKYEDINKYMSAQEIFCFIEYVKIIDNVSCFCSSFNERT